MYKAIEYFTDLKDNCYEYKAGDTYPREGYEPSAERIEELLSSSNKRGRAVIEVVAEKKAEAPVEKPKKRSKKREE